MPRRARTSTEEPDLRRALKLVVDLMKVPGASKSEGAISAEITARLRRAGLAASAIRRDSAQRKTPGGGETGNLFVVLGGTKGCPRRLVSAHMDTVPLCVGARPVRRGGRIVSSAKDLAVGADNRAGVAATLTALLTILERKLPHPPVTFLWTVQEELGLWGAKTVSLASLGRPRMGFNFDGSLNVAIGAVGARRLEIVIDGIASHAGGAPEKGVSAVTVASLAVADLEAGGWLGRVVKGRQRGTSNVGVVRAGEATNVVCPRALIQAEARSHSPALRRRIVGAFEKAFARAAKRVRNDAGRCAKVRFTRVPGYEPFKLSRRDPAVAAAEAAAQAVGMKIEHGVSNGGLDANALTARGVPTVTFATGGMNAHTPKEYLDVRTFERACRVALRLAMGD